MPIFLDRHDIPGVSAEAVAEAHQEDLKIQHEYGCKGLTYWFDEEKGMAFCLIEAPNIESVQQLHNDAHGLIPNQVIQVDPSIVESFLGRIEDPEDIKNSKFPVINDPAFRSIVVVYLDELMPFQASGNKTNVINELKDNLRIELNSHHGLEVEQTPYYLMASFTSIHQSVLYAQKIQTTAEKLSTSENNGIKIGLSAGVPVSGDETLFGPTVKLANRLAWIASPGNVLMDATISEHYKSNNWIKESQNIKTLNTPDEEFLNQLMDIMEDSGCESGFDIKAFCHAMGMSKSKLYRNLTSIAGYSPNDFIKAYRLRRAMKLIRKQQGSVSEIAYESGFSSLSYFSKCFQERFGVLPSEYINTL